MNLSEQDILRQLGRGTSIDSVCRAARITRPEFDAWWRETTAARVASTDGAITAKVAADVTIDRDACGIPYVYADNDADLFFGFGMATAQDRLFQLDYLRRKASGRLSEVLGEEALPLDTIARTVGLHRIAAAEWERLTTEVRELLQAYCDGVNAVINSTADNPPIEFDLLDYRPEPWRPVDCLAIESEFRWYLTGRFPVIAIPELAKRVLGDGPLLEQFLIGEFDDESILHAGDYDPASDSGHAEAVGYVMNDPDSATGSNNWVLAGQRTTTGQPLLGSDPHIAFEAVSCWYEVRLCGGSFNVAGTGYVGIPAVMLGRTERVAWGITNNICSQRDLYLEQTDPAHPGCFLYDGKWEPELRLTETIRVKDGDTIEKTIRFSRNGPIADELLPPGAEQTGPVSVKWLGAYQGGWLTAMLNMNRAASVEEFQQALRPWHVPTFAMVIADVDGGIGLQTSGRIPVRPELERAYRPGWDPDHQWQGLIPFESMPAIKNPDRGWIASANNRLAPNDYPYKLFGCWSSGARAQRIRELIESRPQHSADDMRTMHQDVKSLRAAELIPVLIPHLQNHSDERIRRAGTVLGEWDCCSEPDSSGATIFNVFFTCWCRTVATERFDAATVDLIANGIAGCAGRLLRDDPHGWFSNNDRERRICAAIEDSLNLLTDRLGTDIQKWTWDRLHIISLKHVLSARGDLDQLLDQPAEGVRGDMVTICNSGSGPDWSATSGAGYRQVADLARQPPVLLAIDAHSQSGHPGSLHYSDQFQTWRAGDYHEIVFDRKTASASAVTQFVIQSDR